MTKNQLPVHYTSAEESGRVRPAVDSGSVHITVAHFSAAGSASAASAAAVAPPALPAPERYSKSEEARDSKLDKWLLAAGVMSVTTMFSALYSICNPDWVPSFVAQTVKFSKQLSTGTVAGAAGIHGAPISRNPASAVQPKGETAMYGVTRNSVVSGVGPAAPASLSDVDRTAAERYGSASAAHRTLASDRDETRTRETSAKTSKSIKGFMVPPPPPTPCVVPPGFGFFVMQPNQQYVGPQQQLQQAQAQASAETHDQAAARENTPQKPTAASDSTEATESAALVGADEQLQAALKASLRTVGEWTR